MKGFSLAHGLSCRGRRLCSNSNSVGSEEKLLVAAVADVACAHRSRDGEVARGHLDVITLSDIELRCLDDLWRASVLRYALQPFESEMTTGEAISELEWRMPQLEKPRPFQS
jgi:hypothetical protein